jgi:hypothetical protein
MNWDEYNELFHKLGLNRHAFRRLMECDHEVLRLVNVAITAEREACADICDQHASIEGIAQRCAEQIRARGKT